MLMEEQKYTKHPTYDEAYIQLSASLKDDIWRELFAELWNNMRHQLWEQISRQIEDDLR